VERWESESQIQKQESLLEQDTIVIILVLNTKLDIGLVEHGKIKRIIKHSRG
jgi:hypothetical protein